MKKFLVGILSALMLVTLGVVLAKAYTPPEPITTTYDFITYDNGMQGNQWAVDTFHSTLVITEEDEGVWRVVRTDTGTFESLPGAMSPGGEDGTLIGDGTEGTISGGITVLIQADGLAEWGDQEGPEDLTDSEDGYFVKYFGRFFEDIDSESSEIVDWGWTYATCNNGTWVDNEATEDDYPEGSVMGDITGEYVPCATPTTDVCANIDGDQTGVPDGLHLDASGRNCVAFQLGGPPPPPSGGAVLAGQVLGATTLGATGGAEENIFLALFALGSILVGTGVRKLGVPRE